MKNYADRGGCYPSRPKLGRRQQTLTGPQSSSRNALGGRREQGAKQGVSFRALSSTLLLIGRK